ncbi:MAG: HAMP domain-containing sensor histidine kinase [Bacteroidota bacterium]
MNERLLLIVCSSFAPEIRQIIKANNYPDVSVQSFHANCVAFPYDPDDIAKIAKEAGGEFSKVVFIGSSCITRTAPKMPLAGSASLKIVQLNQCFEFLLNARTIESLIIGGAYLVSNGWLHDLPSHINNWGFEPDTAKRFFAESARKIVMLDTGLPGDVQPQLEELSKYTGLPWEVLPVGLDTCTLRIDSLVREWRGECTHRDISYRLSEVASRSANYTMAFEQMKNLVDSVQESDVVNHLHSTLTMLFAPKDISYEALFAQRESYGSVEMGRDKSDPEKTDSDLHIRLTHGGELLGIMHVMDIAFPQYISRYNDIARMIGRTGGLAIANARKFQTINENEQQLRSIADELRSVIATKDLFFNIIAHDLRSPLNGLLGLSELLVDGSIDLGDTEEVLSVGEDLHSSAFHLHALIENLLQWAQAQRGALNVNLQHLDLQQTIERSIQPLLSVAAHKNITLEVLVQRPFALYVDERMIETVLRNLVSNAIKFTPAFGKVMITAEDAKVNSVLISVRDTGIGMPQDMVEKLFRIETKIHRAGTAGEPGTGLGLMLCKEFVDSLGGSIEVRSEVGVGTAFSFTLEARPHEAERVVHQ